MCGLTPDRGVIFADSVLAPGQGRDYVRRSSCHQHAFIAMDALLLVTNELITNAVLHGQPPISLQLSCSVSEVRLTISDAGPMLPREPGTHGGLGLLIVAGIARQWGATPLAVGKEVWCRVPTGTLR